MDSDLSLLEVSGEDDLLIPNDVNLSSYNSSTYFSCSPLQRIPKMSRTVDCAPHVAVPIERVNGSKDTAEPNLLCIDSRQNSGNEILFTCKNNRESSNKENITANKHETVKLSLEPQQMKRKKMGGGYNLRKSLAWDRAFFTEEGVLDPLELSMLSGSNGKCSGSLGTIPEATYSQSHSLADPTSISNSRSLDNNNNNNISSMELPSSIPNVMTKISSKLPKTSSTGDKIKRQVLTSRDSNRSVSKRSNSHQPITLSSLKSLGHVAATKMKTKDSKVSRDLAPKLDSSSVFTATRSHSINAGNSKIEISQPASNSQKSTGLRKSLTNTRSVSDDVKPAASNSQKSIGLRKSSTNTRSVSDDVKPSSNAKQVRKADIQLPQRSVVKTTSIPRRQLSAVQNHFDSQEVIKDPSLPALSIPTHSNNPRNIPSSFPQNIFTCRNNVQKPEITKPSGLRLPKPSLGFFGQSKSCGVPRLLQGSTQPCDRAESMIPKLSKSAAITPLHVGIPQSSAKKPAHSSMGFSVESPKSISSNACSLPTSCGICDSENVELSKVHSSPSSDSPAEESRTQTVHCDSSSFTAAGDQSLSPAQVDPVSMEANPNSHYDVEDDHRFLGISEMLPVAHSCCSSGKYNQLEVQNLDAAFSPSSKQVDGSDIIHSQVEEANLSVKQNLELPDSCPRDKCSDDRLEDENREMGVHILQQGVNFYCHAPSSDSYALLDMQSNTNEGYGLSAERRWSTFQEVAPMSVADTPLPREDDAEANACDVAGSHSQCHREDDGDEEIQAVSHDIQDDGCKIDWRCSMAADPNPHVIVEHVDEKSKVEFLNVFSNSIDESAAVHDDDRVPDVLHEDDKMAQKGAMDINCCSLEADQLDQSEVSRAFQMDQLGSVARDNVMDLKKMGKEQHDSYSLAACPDQTEQENHCSAAQSEMQTIACVGHDTEDVTEKENVFSNAAGVPPAPIVDYLSDAHEDSTVTEKEGLCVSCVSTEDRQVDQSKVPFSCQMVQLGFVGRDHVTDTEAHCGAGQLSSIGLRTASIGNTDENEAIAEFMDLNCRNNISNYTMVVSEVGDDCSSAALEADQVKQSEVPLFSSQVGHNNGGLSHEEVDKKHHFLDEIDDFEPLVAPVIQPPPNAAPFSDEWLAAFEAAGEVL